MHPASKLLSMANMSTTIWLVIQFICCLDVSGEPKAGNYTSSPAVKSYINYYSKMVIATK